MLQRVLPMALVLSIGCEPPAQAPAADAGADPGTSELPPGPPDVRIEPATPTALVALVAVVDGAPTGVTLRYEWTRDGDAWGAGSVVPAEETAKGERWRVSAVATNDVGDSPPGSAQIVIANAAPSCSAAAITPVDAAVGAPCECRCVGPADPDGDPVQAQCSWLADGEPLGITSCTLPGEATPPKGSALVCRLVPTDGEDSGAELLSSEVVVTDTVPSGGTAIVTPSAPTELEVLECTASGAFDPDGDPIPWSYAWTVNDAAVPGVTEPTLAGEHFDKGDSVRCVATPGAGTAILSEPVVVANSPPALSGASALPAEAGRLESFECLPGDATDPDPADEIALDFAWTRLADGALVGSAPILEPVDLLPGDFVRCRITPTDPEAAGAPVLSLPVQVIDYPPTVQSVWIEPADPKSSATLECVWEAEDADGDPVAAAVTWRVNSKSLVEQTSSTLAGVFVLGDLVECSVSPSDPFLDGPPADSAPVTIANSPPSIEALVIQGEVWCDTFACEAVGVEDADGHAVELSVDLDAAGVEPGQTVSCQVTASDGTDETTATASVVATLSKTIAEAAVLAPLAPVLGDEVECVAVGLTDPCGEPVIDSITWTVNGVEVGQGTALDTGGLEAGDLIACELVGSAGAWSVGVPVASASVALQAPPPEAPIVAIEAPSGADGPLFCAVIEPGTPGLVFETRWTVGDGPEEPGFPTLPASATSHCDRVRCRQVALVGGAEISSNTAEFVLPTGTDCDDANPCTSLSCFPGGGCAHAPVIGPCEDGDACTTGDACDDVTCTGSPLDCDDASPCTSNACDSQTGCTAAPIPGGCDDGSACTIGDTCDQGTCAGSPLVCDDGDPCTVDACDALAGCVTSPAEGACDDGETCTSSDACESGVCTGVAVQQSLPCPLDTEQGYCSQGACTQNQAPAPPQVAIEPPSPVTGDAVSCVATGSVDPDEWPDPIAYVTTWTVNSEPVGPDLPAVLVVEGASLECTAWATDGAKNSGSSVAAVIVGNAPPTIGPVTVQGTASAGLVCDFDSSDPDDPPTSVTDEVAWTVDGEPAGTGPTLAAGAVSSCDLVWCTVTSSDGEAVATASSDSAVMAPGPDCGQTQCAVYICYPGGGCLAQPGSGACNDQDPCTDGDTCDGFVCAGQPVAPLACYDADPCTDDLCVSGVGCTFEQSTDCDDGVACTVDACDADLGCTVDGSPPPESAFELEIGVPETLADLVIPADEGPIELVYGAQGGYHVDLGYRVIVPEGYGSGSPVLTELHGELRTPCCTGQLLADFDDPNWPSWEIATGTHHGIFSIVLPTAQAPGLVGDTVCFTLEAGLFEGGDWQSKNTISATDQQVLTIVNEK